MKKLMVAIAAAAISFAGFADDTNKWFTAGFGDGVTSTGGGWVTEGSVTEPSWNEATLMLADVGADAPVVFKATDSNVVDAVKTVVFKTSVKFQGFDELPAIDTGAKAGVCALTASNYFVVAYKEETGKLEWEDTGKEAEFESPVEVEVSVSKAENGTYAATYTFSYDNESGSGSFSMEVPITANSFQEVCYSGNGSVSALAADTILAGVAIKPPTIDGLKVTCDKERAAVGSEVTVTFAADKKIPSKGTAVYIVQTDGTLTIKPGDSEPEALDPAAKIDGKPYLTFAEAYAAALEEDTIVICANQVLVDDTEVFTFAKSVNIDLNGCAVTNVNDFLISAVTLTVEGDGEWVIAAPVDVYGSDAVLDISDIKWSLIEDSYLTGTDGTIKFGEDCDSPNKMFHDGVLIGEDADTLAELNISVGESEYACDSGADVPRYVNSEEIAYAYIGATGEGYYDSFATVQDAIDVSDEVYLSDNYEFPTDEDLEFNANTIVYAYNGEDDLTGDLTVDGGEVEWDDTLGDNGGWKAVTGEPAASYEVSWTGGANAEVVAKVDGAPITNGTKVENTKVVVFTVTPKTDYEFAEAEYTDWEKTEGGALTCEITVEGEAVAVVIPDATAVEEPTTYVAKIGDVEFETLQEAFASEAEGDIVLLDNVTLTETLSVNKDFVLNLGGKTLTSTLPSVAWAIRLGDTAEVTAVISNGTIVANQYGVRVNQTDLKLDTVTITSTLRALQSTTSSDIDLVGCTISAAPNAEDEIAVLTKGGTLDLVDTTVNSGAKGLDLGGTVATIDADSVISVDGVNCAVFVGSDAGVKTQLTVAGKVEATASHTSDNDSIYAISGNGTDEIGADVTISEGADISVTADETAIYWPNAGTLTVNGGSITGGTAIWAKSGNVVVNGGTISATGAAAEYAEDNDGVTPTGDAIVFEKLSGDNTGYANNLTASITGGTISSAYGKAVVSVAREGETALAGFVSGGTFSSAIPEEFCASGFIPMANDDGTYGVKEGAYVAQVGAVKYETVAAALAAVQALETAGTFPIVITALADDGLTITDTDRAASIAKDVTITIPSVGSWEVSGVLTYSGVIEGTVAASDIVILDGGSITLGVNALVTVGLASELEEDSFIAPGGYKVMVMSTMDAKSFKVVEIPTYAITWTDPENATVVAIDEEGVAVTSGNAYAEGSKIAFTVAPKDDFTYAGVDLGTAWTLLESGAISNLVTVGTTAVEVVIPEAVAAAPAWDIPGAEGGINALVKEDGVTKYVEFTSITFTATGATVGLKAAKIAAQAEPFGLICKTDLTKGDTFVINASLSVAEGDPDAKNGLFTISTDLSGYDQLFVVGVGPAAVTE